MRKPYRKHHRAFTLVEMLVAMVLTLILVTAIAEFYAIIGDTVKDGRAMIEVSGRVRAAVNRLNEDLENITCQVAPWTDDGSDGGYFEYYEGPASDYDSKGFSTPATAVIDATRDVNSNGIPDLVENGITTTIGDCDDYLAFTIRSLGHPLTGRYSGNTASPPVMTVGGNPSVYSSEYAEVIWWVGWDDLPTPGNTANVWDYDEPKYLYRRQLLIRPDLPIIPPSSIVPNNFANAELYMRKLWQESDVSMSVRYNGTSYYIQPNSLADLSRRENRFAHTQYDPATGIGSQYPFIQKLKPSVSMKTATVITSYVLQAPNGNAAESPGEDIMLSNVLAFDVQIYDPNVRIWPDNNGVTALLPSDPGYRTKTTGQMVPPTSMVGMGGFVDMNYYRWLPAYFSNTLAAGGVDATLANSPYLLPLPQFAGPPNPKSGLVVATYDTWALSYERDGINQDNDTVGGSPLIDEATNGADDDPVGTLGYGLVDDVGERETAPPYADPIRGLRVRIRVYEPSTRQTRQATVATDFITE